MPPKTYSTFFFQLPQVSDSPPLPAHPRPARTTQFRSFLSLDAADSVRSADARSEIASAHSDVSDVSPESDVSESLFSAFTQASPSSQASASSFFPVRFRQGMQLRFRISNRPEPRTANPRNVLAQRSPLSTPPATTTTTATHTPRPHRRSPPTPPNPARSPSQNPPRKQPSPPSPSPSPHPRHKHTTHPHTPVRPRPLTTPPRPNPAHRAPTRPPLPPTPTSPSHSHLLTPHLRKHRPASVATTASSAVSTNYRHTKRTDALARLEGRAHDLTPRTFSPPPYSPLLGAATRGTSAAPILASKSFMPFSDGDSDSDEDEDEGGIPVRGARDVRVQLVAVPMSAPAGGRRDDEKKVMGRARRLTIESWFVGPPKNFMDFEDVDGEPVWPTAGKWSFI
ncbi:hypothetical protein K439DRAFT_1615433 [Ramaria rubella]|nr:hypothetical protein K439DRAFT_1615433 [Ramaria rubella]